MQTACRLSKYPLRQVFFSASTPQNAPGVSTKQITGLWNFSAFNSAALSNEAKASLRELAQILKEDPTTDIAIIGHTDKVGTYEANMKVSKNRAYAVENYLQDCGVSPAQFKKVEGVGYNEYDESLSADQNRRVEVYMYASEQMIKNAEAAN